MPFFLDMNTPPEGEDLREHLVAKYGREAIERFERPNNPLDVAGAKVGIQFNKGRRFINTVDCHRLVEWCNRENPQKSDALMQKMFHAYFEEAKDLSKRDELEAVATEVGLSSEDVGTVLGNKDMYRQEVIDADRQAKHSMRVSGVPYFIIENCNGRPTAFSGAQPPEVIAEVLLESCEDA
mmetsp:Transcript_8643/g.12905  ORF Transcript_8643/g.12905 Transcript_8643/m.12905 type:complete len:181 (+) Transcript_8643:185-727(+)